MSLLQSSALKPFESADTGSFGTNGKAFPHNDEKNSDNPLYPSLSVHPQPIRKLSPKSRKFSAHLPEQTPFFQLRVTQLKIILL